METTIETAHHLLIYYSGLLTPGEKVTLHLIYSRGSNANAQFVQQCAKRLLTEHPDKVYINLCPSCSAPAGKLQPITRCRVCGYGWY